MKFFSVAKDGGPESHVWGFFICEIKWLFSVVVLCFEDGSRDAYHSHAFNAISWLLRGRLLEILKDKNEETLYNPSIFPILTYRSTFHKVISGGRSWVLSFRGPWSKTWNETVGGEDITLTDGRVLLEQIKPSRLRVPTNQEEYRKQLRKLIVHSSIEEVAKELGKPVQWVKDLIDGPVHTET